MSFIFFVNKYPLVTDNPLKDGQIQTRLAEVLAWQHWSRGVLKVTRIKMGQALWERKERDEKIFKQSASISPKKNKFSPNTTDFFLIKEAWIKAPPACIPASAGAQPSGLSSGGVPGAGAGEPGRGQNSLYTQVQA